MKTMVKTGILMTMLWAGMALNLLYALTLIACVLWYSLTVLGI